MDLWLTEKHRPDLGQTFKVTNILHKETTPYQELAIIESPYYGRSLLLDGIMQTNITEEFIYHEMMAHVALFTHPNPQKALVIGGGDGGVIREILKHPSIKKAVLVEIDRRVVELCKEYLPEISCGLDNPRTEVLIEDGIKYVQNHKNEFDYIVIDSTDPIGPAVGLFAGDFYKAAYEALKEDGIFVAQTESPFINPDVVNNSFREISKLFPITRVFTAFIPHYQSGCWTFTMGSKKYDPLKVDIEKIPAIETRYYNPEIHHAVFMLPTFIKNLLKK
jgi:spermidine synthase